MGNNIKTNEPEATASMPMLPEIAILGDFTLVIDHFISEITDCTQQHKKDTPAARPRSTVLPGFRHGMALSKMDFRTAFV